MRLWLSVLVVTVATWAMKASGPIALGSRPLPSVAHNVIRLMAPVLLAGLVVVELGGATWTQLNWQQLLGVAAAGGARVLKAPVLLAVICGVATTAALRVL